MSGSSKCLVFTLPLIRRSSIILFLFLEEETTHWGEGEEVWLGIFRIKMESVKKKKI